MNIEDYFSANYVEARAQFLELSEANGFDIRSLRNEVAQAPDGSDLYLDVATKGATDASRLLMITSATHGVEGYCGSGVQAALLAGDALEPWIDDLQIALVHGVNPYGFAHDRRVNEDNIDLNRNFLDFGVETPRNIGYADIHPYLVPEEWEGEKRLAADASLAQFIKTNGAAALQQAASGGQYTHPDGLFYGGAAPSWSAQTMTTLAQELGGHTSQTIVIDFHTGLGPYGYGEMIAAGSPEQVARTFEFYDQFELTDPDAGTSSSASVQGTMAHGIERSLPGVNTIFVALEYGTLHMNEVMVALRADNWLYHRGELTSPLGSQIKRQIRDAFYCDETDWKEKVWSRASEVIDATLAKLKQS